MTGSAVFSISADVRAFSYTVFKISIIYATKDWLKSQKNEL
jgi:hypothetical protein